ncbi:MAG: LysM domain-containing protein, partial [bacterium]|nr:LysM domain-containing protein [bacterium]
MKKLEKFAISLAVVAVAGLASVAPVNASIFGDDDDTDLGNLFILDRLFAGGLSGGATAGQRTVAVEPGDTLSGIALTFLGNANLWPSIASLNNLANPDLIFPGQTIALPAAVQTDGGGIFGGDLGNLIILDELFGGGDGGLFGGEGNLGNLFILDA